MSGTILANGATEAIYIFQDGSDIKYKINIDGTPSNVPFTCTITNTNSGINPEDRLYVYIETDITITDPNQFFIAGSANIEFNGKRNSITVSNVSNYPGFIENGRSGLTGQFLVIARYIRIIGDNSTLLSSSGWVCQDYFANGITSNYIFACSSNAPISNNSGGILGNNAGINSGDVFVSECYSLGAIGSSAGGICAAGGSDSTVVIRACYSEGTIGAGAGGILAASSEGTITIANCYSRGNIGNGGGGICGSTTGGSVSVSNCYSSGSIGTLSGGIFGVGITGSASASHCYSCGTGSAVSSGGIYANSNNDNLLGANNYSELNSGTPGTWSDTHANNNILQDVPITGRLLGGKWSRLSAVNNTIPYEFNRFGLSPYTNNVQSYYETTVQQGQTTSASLLSPGYAYSIVEVYDDNEDIVVDFSGLSINSSTGAITVSRSFAAGYYEIIIRDAINPYDITPLQLTIDLICYGAGTQVLIRESVILPTNIIDISDSDSEYNDRIIEKYEEMYVDKYVDIAKLRSGMLVKTLRHGYLPIESVGVKTIRTGHQPSTTLYKLSADPEKGRHRELQVTGSHSILIRDRQEIPSPGARISPHKIDCCRRILAKNWPGAKPMPAGELTRIYHLVLAGAKSRYAIWVNGGWLSETTSRESFKKYRFTPIL